MPQYHRQAAVRTDGVGRALASREKDCGIRRLRRYQTTGFVSKWIMLTRRLLSTLVGTLVGVTIVTSAAAPKWA